MCATIQIWSRLAPFSHKISLSYPHTVIEPIYKVLRKEKKMKEYTFICPHCGKAVEVDENGYAAIIKQIRDDAFQADLEEQKRVMETEREKAVELAKTQAAMEFREKEHELDSQMQNLRSDLKAAKENAETAAKLSANDAERKYGAILSEKELEIAKLHEQVRSAKTDTELAVAKAEAEANERFAKQQEVVANLKAKNEMAEAQAKLHEQELVARYEGQLKDKDALVEYYRDLKARQSTKMIGETLEQHCEAAFNQVRAIGFQNAYFEKDNEVSASGSKGDFIFRDYDENGMEYVSIMMEMKNENETTASKHKNTDFLKELDKDRREKGCEYAVLVTMLEADNEFYNNGIVDMSHVYPKMYVIRPQFLIPFITIIRNAARSSIAYKRELEEQKAQNIDVTNFEAKLLDFKDKFSRNYTLASDRFSKAIDEIDKTIDHLQKVKDNLLSSENNLRLANNKLDDLTIKRLTRGNKTMQQMFADTQAQAVLPESEKE